MAADTIFRIGPDQAPRTGSHYPFIGAAAANILPLVQDLYLAYSPVDDSSAANQNTARYAYPLRVSEVKMPEVEGDLTWEQITTLWENWDTNWEDDLTGLVTRVGPVILDADDVVVFDPVDEGAAYHVAPWGVDRLLVEWIGDGKVMRLVVSVDALVAFSVDESVIAEDSTLDPRSYTQMNSGVKSLYGGNLYATQQFQFRAGYNTRIDVEPSELIEGTRRTHRLIFNAIAGAGEGKTPGCAGEIDFLTSINNQLPDDSGRIRLETDDCYRFQIPVTLAGVATVTPNALQLFSACEPRCPPSYYVNTYRGVSKLWFQWQSIADDLTTARDNFIDSVSRWNLQRDCRRNNPAKIIVVPEPNCRLAISAVYCNAGKTCLHPLEMRFLIEVLSGSPSSTPTLCGPAIRNGSSIEIEEAVLLSGSWPLWYTTFDYLDPQRSANVQFRICIPGCANKQVRVTLTVHSPSTGDIEESVVLGGPSNGSSYSTRANIVRSAPLNSLPTLQGGVCSC